MRKIIRRPQRPGQPAPLPEAQHAAAPPPDARVGQHQPADWTEQDITLPRPKQLVSLRLDADVLDYFRATGRGYQTRINAVLRAYMQARRR